MRKRTITESTPTQVAHPWRSVLRTIVAGAVGVAVTWIALNFGIDLGQFSEAMATSITGAIWTLGTGLAQWVITLPAVDRFLSARVGILAAGVHTETGDDESRIVRA